MLSSKIKINRIIDANINRAKEGLRVCEEITRFILENYKLTSELKQLRHKISELKQKLPSDTDLIKERDSDKDIGKNITMNELKRKDLKDIFFANMQRVKEAIRVLEEFSKLIDTRLSVEFKKSRYRAYEIEKKVAERLSSLLNHR
ncbi:MAG: thiamine-phosphate pyrophosphorylase [Candidatus Omnitrophota bacterium]